MCSRDRRVNMQETGYLAKSGGRTHGKNRLLRKFGLAFLPSGIFTNVIFTIWHFYQCHFYHLTFLPLAFLPSGIFTNDIFTIWHIYQWHFYHLAFLPMAFVPYGIFTNGIFTYGNLTYGIFTNGIFTAHRQTSINIWAKPVTSRIM